MTLRLSLIHSLTKAVGADLQITQHDIGGYEIAVYMQSPEPMVAIAAE
jgi:hypothetical protein